MKHRKQISFIAIPHTLEDMLITMIAGMRNMKLHLETLCILLVLSLYYLHGITINIGKMNT